MDLDLYMEPYLYPDLDLDLYQDLEMKMLLVPGIKTGQSTSPIIVK